jgi:CheY-like chemotaxis protein/signal transduction histidine kinase
MFAGIKSRSIFWKLIAPVSFLLVACGVAAVLWLPGFVQRGAEKEAIEAGQETVRQFNILRKYYTDNVIAKVLSKSELKVSFDHLDDANAVPLPATMILDLSTLFRESGTTLKLYSPYPFPNRRERQLDKFGEDAWVYFQSNPEKTFSRVESVDGQTVVRVATADRMVTQACVACHNSLASSPKKDWKLGDVRGVLEVDSSRQLANGERIVIQVLATLGAMLVLLAVLLRLLYVRSIARPLAMALDSARAMTAGGVEKVRAVEAIADGELEQELSIAAPLEIDRTALADDEIGQLLKSVLGMSDVQRALDQSIGKMTASLRAGRSAEQARDWLKSAQNELNTLMRGEHETRALAERVLFFLADRSGAGVAVMFLHDEQAQQLSVAATYAVTRATSLNAHLAPGEGLVGQAVREGRTMLINGVPRDYLPIGSALGSAEPCSVLVVPLLHGDNQVGAIELASFRPFSAAAIELVETVRESIAIGFEVNLARQRTQGLLVGMEEQTEELRVQQEELQQSNEELEERAALLEQQREQIRAKNAEVETASREIWHKAEELQKVSAYKSEFMANMSHELRTPLNSMLILSGLLAENKGQNLTRTQVEYAGTINGAGKDLLNLINDILDLSKVEAGQIQFNYEAATPLALCSAMDAMFHPQAGQKGLAWRTEVDCAVPAQIEIDVQRTEQVLKNLIANAIKFTHEGGVTLRLYLPRPDDNPLAVPAIACAVTDTGIGVPADKRELIFEAFRQADGGISRSYGGTGLGLSISLQLACRMGGSLTLASTPGAGSTFTLFLPLAAATPGAALAPVAPPAAEAAPAWAGAGKRRILIIEDDATFAGVLAHFVQERGFEPLIAADGESGIALAQQTVPSAVLLDVMLPTLDGWAVMRNLKENPATRHIPIHFITCLEERKRAMEMGAVGFVTKPVSAQQLDRVIATVEAALDAALRRVLVVEDNVAEARSILALLSERQMAITLAGSGAQALALLAAERFDCMVLDLGLADMSGFEVLAQMQALEPTRRVPVIVHSGQDLTREQEHELHRYAESIIIKGAKSPERLLNEVTLFLHMLESQMDPEKRRMLRASLDREVALDGKKMLIVDDDMRNVYSLSSLLADKGIVVVEAANGREALARLAAHPDICLVLMDIMMPEMDGFEAMRRIRAAPAWRELPVIAMTAKVMKGDQQRCLDAGASDYIAKPIDADKLMTLLRVWANRF